MLQKLKRTNTKETLEEETSCYVLIPAREALLFRLKNAIENAQRSIDYICSCKAFRPELFILCGELKKAMRIGVKIRWIIDKPEDMNSWSELKAFTKNPSFRLRTISDFPSVRFHIYDKKEVFIDSYPKTEAAQSPSLWTNNPSHVELAHNYFETMWKTALENKTEITNYNSAI